MSVVVTMLGRLGNNLFQYAIGRIIAEHHGFAFNCAYRPSVRFAGIDCGPTSTLSELAEYFPNAPLSIPGRSYSLPVQSFDVENGEGWRGHVIDLEGILSDRTARRLHLAGFFQRFCYFRDHQSTLRRWFTLRQTPTPYCVRENDVIVNIRRGNDFRLNDWILSAAYYDRVIQALPNVGTIYICGTAIDAPLLAHLSKYSPVCFEASPVHHFAFIQRFKRIILSNSTFAWWAAFLSDAEEIYAPHSLDGSFYAFTGYRDVDLNMGHRRYISVALTNSDRCR